MIILNLSTTNFCLSVLGCRQQRNTALLRVMLLAQFQGLCLAQKPNIARTVPLALPWVMMLSPCRYLATWRDRNGTHREQEVLCHGELRLTIPTPLLVVDWFALNEVFG